MKSQVILFITPRQTHENFMRRRKQQTSAIKMIRQNEDEGSLDL